MYIGIYLTSLLKKIHLSPVCPLNLSLLNPIFKMFPKTLNKLNEYGNKWILLCGVHNRNKPSVASGSHHQDQISPSVKSESLYFFFTFYICLHKTQNAGGFMKGFRDFTIIYKVILIFVVGTTAQIQQQDCISERSEKKCSQKSKSNDANDFDYFYQARIM